MFTKIIVAEDHDSENRGIISSIKEYTKAQVDTAQFCDQTKKKVQKAILTNTPYELLISDLSFTLDHKTHEIKSGKQLIDKVKTIQPNIKVIVFTGEEKPAIIKSLFENYQIDGYVCKGLYGLSELNNAIKEVYKNKTYKCPVASDALRQKNIIQLDQYEIELLKLLSQGYKQDQISIYFIEKDIHPNSKRSIEDRLSKLRDDLAAKNNNHLINIANKLGFI